MTSRTVGPRLFTLAEAEALLPFVAECLHKFRSAQQQVEACRRDLLVLRMVSSSGGHAKSPDSEALRAKERQEAELLHVLHQVQDDLLQAGCVPKSLHNGLVDFFALKGDRLVFLCWREGEERITTWHTLEGGFSGRQSVETLIGPVDDA